MQASLALPELGNKANSMRCDTNTTSYNKTRPRRYKKLPSFTTAKAPGQWSHFDAQLAQKNYRNNRTPRVTVVRSLDGLPTVLTLPPATSFGARRRLMRAANSVRPRRVRRRDLLIKVDVLDRPTRLTRLPNLRTPLLPSPNLVLPTLVTIDPPVVLSENPILLSVVPSVLEKLWLQTPVPNLPLVLVVPRP